MFGTGLYLFAAVRTGKAVVFAIDIPHTDCHLHPPMFRQQPLITVGDTGTDTPTLITGRLEIGINAEGELYLRHIVFAPEQMETEKMPVKFFAKPVTVFGLHKPMLPLLALVKLKRVERTGNVQRGFPAKAPFQSQIWTGRCPTQQIRFNAYLCRCRGGYTA